MKSLTNTSLGTFFSVTLVIIFMASSFDNAFAKATSSVDTKKLEDSCGDTKKDLDGGGFTCKNKEGKWITCIPSGNGSNSNCWVSLKLPDQGAIKNLLGSRFVLEQDAINLQRDQLKIEHGLIQIERELLEVQSQSLAPCNPNAKK